MQPVGKDEIRDVGTGMNGTDCPTPETGIDLHEQRLAESAVGIFATEKLNGDRTSQSESAKNIVTQSLDIGPRLTKQQNNRQ